MIEVNYPVLTNGEYIKWRETIEKKYGIYFDESRVTFLCKSLLDRMRIHAISRYDDYYHYLSYHTNAQEEWRELVCCLVNNDTKFFRHEPSFKILTEFVIPELILKKSRAFNKIFSLWSVGCSSGNEAYSLALSALENYDTDEFYTRVIGSDINVRLLTKARKGIYSETETKSLDTYYMNKYMYPIFLEGQVYYKFVDRVKDLVSFYFINLFEPDTYKIFMQDLIFFQNVLIYFNGERRINIIEKLSNYLVKGGYLFLSPSDLIDINIPGLETVHFNNSIIYRKL